MQAAREKEWEKQVVLEREKVELEERVAEQERLQCSTVEDCHAKMDRLEAAFSQLQDEKVTAFLCIFSSTYPLPSLSLSLPPCSLKSNLRLKL